MALIHMPTLAVFMTNLGATFINTVFVMYYMKVLLDFYQINALYLNLAQMLFMVWNAINDPLIGCVQDVGCGKSCHWMMNRRKVIFYMGPVFSASFLLFWFPWSRGSSTWLVGLHMLVALFIYDTLLSFVMSAYCGLFTELSTEHSKRVRVVIYMEIMGFIGSLVIFPIDKMSSNLHEFHIFQYLCIGLAFLSALCFINSGIYSPSEVAQRVYLDDYEYFSVLEKAGYPGIYNIFFPDIIDEDMLRHKRKSPLSTLIFTLNALITKPAHSLAPMIVVSLLSGVKYSTYIKIKQINKENYPNAITQLNTNLTFNITKISMSKNEYENLYDNDHYCMPHSSMLCYT